MSEQHTSQESLLISLGSLLDEAHRRREEEERSFLELEDDRTMLKDTAPDGNKDEGVTLHKKGSCK